MSTASISYSSLKNASNEAKSVAKKLDSYSDSLTNNVYKKLNSYSGSWSSNLTAARSRTSEKISELNTEQTKYERYAEDLIDLRDECKTVDKAVKSRVSTLTASFKSSYGIKNNVVINQISYLCTAIGNSTNVGRWLGDAHDAYVENQNSLWSSIKEWYHYEGGEEFIKGMVVSVLEIAVGVVSVAAAIFSGGALIVVIAGVIAGIISVVSGAVDLYNEEVAYLETSSDPAKAYRRRNVNSIQDYLTSTFIYEDWRGVDSNDDESYYASYKEEYGEIGSLFDNLALGIDIVNLACTVVTVVNSLGNLIKNGYKWATGTTAKVTFKENFKDIFSSKTITSFKQKFLDIGQAFKSGGITVLFDYGKFMVSDFRYNLNNNFFKFDDLKSTTKSYKAIASLALDVAKADWQKVVIEDIVLPGLTFFSVNADKADTWIVSDKNNMRVTSLKFYENISFSSVWGIVDKTADKIVGSDVWSKLCDKFSGGIEVNVAVPDLSSLADLTIYIPTVDIPVLRTAA